MVKTFATNENNDLFIATNGNLAITTGLDAILQACQTAAKAQRGEMIYNTTLGVPNFETIWARGIPNLAQYEAALRQTLLGVEGVTNVTDLLVTNQNNVLSYQANIVTDQGTATINGNTDL